MTGDLRFLLFKESMPCPSKDNFVVLWLLLFNQAETKRLICQLLEYVTGHSKNLKREKSFLVFLCQTEFQSDFR